MLPSKTFRKHVCRWFARDFHKKVITTGLARFAHIILSSISHTRRNTPICKRRNWWHTSRIFNTGWSITCISHTPCVLKNLFKIDFWKTTDLLYKLSESNETCRFAVHNGENDLRVRMWRYPMYLLKEVSNWIGCWEAQFPRNRIKIDSSPTRGHARNRNYIPSWQQHA